MKVKILVNVDIPEDFSQKATCRKCPFVQIKRNAVGYEYAQTKVGCSLLSCPFQSEEDMEK